MESSSDGGTFPESVSDCCVISSSAGPLPEPVVNGQPEEKVRQVTRRFENQTFSQKKASCRGHFLPL